MYILASIITGAIIVTLYAAWRGMKWLFARNLTIECICGSNFGTLPSSIDRHMARVRNVQYRPATFSRITELHHAAHRWFSCPFRSSRAGTGTPQSNAGA